MDYVYIPCGTLSLFGLRNYLVTSYRILLKQKKNLKSVLLEEGYSFMSQSPRAGSAYEFQRQLSSIKSIES